MGEDKTTISRMALLLKSGATMLNELCPACRVPLFKLKTGDVLCPSCGQRFLLVSSDEEEMRARASLTLQALETTILEKIELLRMKAAGAESIEELVDVGRALATYLQVLELARRVRSGEQISPSKG
ncbi:MAG: Sjogren's syndrome/scleroderma autoantigen 1 family protein [Thermofilum sp.]|uniref:Sjogrens syndrome scleroderma autoantigen 1 n=1 Tax=Thermofilum pendens TaxID=2269 RepID=A0A7C4D1X9_THEPE